MDLRLILRFMVILTVFAGFMAVPVLGDDGGVPAMPHSFFGQVTVGEDPAPAGSNVSGTAPGGGGFIIVREPGIYATTGLTQKLMIQGPIDEGAPISFFVDGVPAECREVSSPDWQESYPFVPGGFTNLDLRSAGQAIPVADFTAFPRQGAVPLLVQFTDLSTGSPDHWVWNFGDGTTGATERNPSHIYYSFGNYTVSLTVWNDQGSSSITFSGYITVTPPVPGVPVANFVGNPTAGFVPLHVQFTDLSTGVPTAWQWNFGDGSPNATVNDPLHTYETPGTYAVSLTASNSFGEGTVTKTGFVTATALPPPPIVDFSADITSGDAPLPVQFAGTATGTPFDWAWNFGDNTTGSGKDPLHLYAIPGTYSVSVVATDVGGTGNAARPGYITALLPPPTANFSATPRSGYFPVNVSFTDLSAGWPATWDWDFGDNSTHSTEQNPVHRYADLGNFTVTLTVENARGNDTQVQSGFITVLEPTSPVADFGAGPLLGMQPLLVTFTDRSVGSPTSWVWDFGDGSSSTAQNPAHTYNAGRYTVSLTVANVKGNNTATRTDYIYVASGGGSGGGGGGGGGGFFSDPKPTSTLPPANQSSSNQTSGNTTTMPTTVVTSWPVTTATPATSLPTVTTTQMTPLSTGATETTNEFPLIPVTAVIVIVCVAAGAGAYYLLKPGNKPPEQPPVR